MELKLDQMKALSDFAGNPEKCVPSIHVAGSKGKGSVTAMIACILEAAGIKTARYSSPHVSDFRERLTSGNDFFEEDIYIKAGNELKKTYEKLSRSSNYAGKENDPSFFELLTLWFFLCAKLSGCKAMAVETGMGGRLDSTNILDPLVSVITIIELEHTEYLGNSVSKIAGEKAGIIKAEKPLILAEQTDEALKVFHEHAAKNKSPVIYLPQNAEIKNLAVSRNGSSFSLVLKNSANHLKETISDLFISIPGEVQAKNAALAVLAVTTAFPEIKNRHIRKGLANFTLPARFELILNKPPVIIDGAHTKRSIELCLETFSALYGKGNILIFGCAAGKDVLSMAKLCVPVFSKIIITTPGTFKTSNPQEIFNVFEEEIRSSKKDIELFFMPETELAFTKARNIAMNKDLSILAAGSFYLAAEIRKVNLSPVDGS